MIVVVIPFSTQTHKHGFLVYYANLTNIGDGRPGIRTLIRGVRAPLSIRLR